MSLLNVRINYSAKTATFWGPGTFDAKETIKSLGVARWKPAEKAWEVSGFQKTFEALKEMFPEIVLAEQVGEVEEAVQSVTNVPQVEGASHLPKSLSVSEFTLQARNAIKQAFPGRIFIHGVISSIKHGKDGRAFLEIAEEDKPDEVVRCVIWRDSDGLSAKLRKAGFKLEADLQVMFEVEVELHRKWSSISLVIVGIVAEYTLAKLKAQRDITNERLKKDGLFDKNKEKSLPFLPTRLGIITSGTGTVINDFRNSLDKAAFGFELFWCKSSVQGAEAKKQLIQALKKLDSMDELDAILVFRGGGSVADLSIFNDYELAKTVCRCRKPVVSAIGHQEDHTSVQDVSFLALGVPKDLGNYFADIVIQKRLEVAEFIGEIRYGYSNIIAESQRKVVERALAINSLGTSMLRNQREMIKRISRAIPNQAKVLRKKSFQSFVKTALPISALAQQSWMMQQKEMARLSNIFSRWTSRLLEEKERAIVSLEKLFLGVSPEVQLKRGFVLLRKAGSEQPLKNGKELKHGDSVMLQFHDIIRGATIDDTAGKKEVENE